jgi:plasmid stabilization system protein ParE/predicted transcriptional regulator
MSGYQVQPEAYTDLDAIREYIAEDNPAAAARVIIDIFDAIRALVPFPRKDHQRIELTSRPLRFWRVRDYLIAYAHQERPLWAVAVLHGSRNPRVMASILKGREQTLKGMEIHLTPEQEAQLSRIASYAGTDTERLVMDAVARLLEQDARFRAAVRQGIAQADRVEFIEEEEMDARMERMLNS